MSWYVAAVLLLLTALVFRLGLLAYAIYAVFSVMLVSRYLTRLWAESLEGERRCTQLTANVGDTIAVNLRIENKGSLPIPWALVEDLLPKHALMYDPPSLEVLGRRVILSGIAAKSSKSVVYQLRCRRRGYYQLGPLVMETGDLFGLHRRYRVASKPSYLMVYPRVVPLEGYELASRRPIGEVRMTHRLFEDPTRIAGVRAYQEGDPLRRVHWAATARTGKLQSKVYEPSTVAGATVVLDMHKDSNPRRHEPVRSELAVTSAASLASAVYQMGQQIGLITNGRDAADRIRQEGWAFDMRTRNAARKAAAMAESSDRLRPQVIPTARGPEQFIRILECLARVERTDGLTLAQLLGETQSRMPRDATVVAILQRVSEQSSLALGMLRRQGFAVTAIINTHDHEDFALAAGPLVAQGVSCQHLPDETSIVAVCRQFILR